MSLSEDLSERVDDIIGDPWDVVEGRVVPEIDKVRLDNHGINLSATMLYADLADSTAIARHDREIAAALFKSFLDCCSRIIRNENGYIRSFDGDRIMAVFVGTSKNTRAVASALNINYAVTKIIRPKFDAAYKAFQNGTLSIHHCTGVDTSDVLVARTGIRDNNDLVWVGRAPNIAAKLSTRRNSPYNSYITERVFTNMTDKTRYSSDGEMMWERKSWDGLPDDMPIIYRSSWWREP